MFWGPFLGVRIRQDVRNINSQHLPSTSYVPGTVQVLLGILSYSIFTHRVSSIISIHFAEVDGGTEK